MDASLVFRSPGTEGFIVRERHRGEMQEMQRLQRFF